jgi:hypothetical protein
MSELYIFIWKFLSLLLRMNINQEQAQFLKLKVDRTIIDKSTRFPREEFHV